MPLPGQTKAESDQERIMLALERIASILQVMNANLATVAKTMIDASPIGEPDGADPNVASPVTGTMPIETGCLHRRHHCGSAKTASRAGQVRPSGYW